MLFRKIKIDVGRIFIVRQDLQHTPELSWMVIRTAAT